MRKFWLAAAIAIPVMGLSYPELVPALRHWVTAAFLYSVVAVAAPGLFPKASLAEVFWDVTDVVTALVVLGLALEIKAKGRTSEAIKKLIGLQAKTARVLRDGSEIDVPVEQQEP